MKRRTKQSLALFGSAAVITLAWPGASAADTTLGGYSGTAMAQAVRIQIYEPVIPIPATPQIDGGIGYAKSNVDTGPVSRATASYLWPGDVIGDGFSQLVGNEKAQYPVQVNSKYPATQGAPAKNTAQLTEGNGMTTSTDGFATRATVTGLGVAGPDTDLLSGIGQGLSNLPGLGKPPSSSSPSLPDAPVPVGKLLAGLVTLENVRSTSSVVVRGKTVTSTAQTALSQVKLLGGLVSIDDMRSTSTTVSDGVKATTNGSIDAGIVKVAGMDLGLAGSGVKLGGSAVKPPTVPATLTKLLEKIGISVTFAPSARNAEGAAGSLAATALEISIDTQPLKTALNIGGLVAPLQELIGKIPQLGSQIAPLLGLGPKIVFRIADVTSSATASPAYTGGPIPAGSGGSTAAANPATGNTGPVDTGGGAPLNPGGGALPGQPADTGQQMATQPTQPSSFALPRLGTTPRLVILGALVLAGAAGWLLRAVGGFILGGAGSCAHGLSTGVPDLRKG
jgi:hypothetical protein